MPNYRSLVPGGFFSSPDHRGEVNPSIWSNNPGAINGDAAWVKKEPGFVTTVRIGGGNPIAVFETPEEGVALWYKLIQRYRANGIKTLQGIVNRYGGGQDYSEYVKFVVRKTGYAAAKEIDPEDLNVLMALGKAMFWYEAGKPTPLKDEQILYGIRLGQGVKPPAEAPAPSDKKGSGGLLGGLTRVLGWPWNGSAKPTEKPSAAAPAPMDSFAERLLRAMKAKGYVVDEGDDVVNIAYVAGMNEEGVKNANRTNAFDDVRVVFRVVDGKPVILGSWQATIETGKLYTEHPIVSGGAARIAFNQFKAWQVGYHRGKYEALVQTGGPVTVHRDLNEDYDREGDRVQTGYFGINQHHAYNAPKDDIGANSAGCLVGRMVKSHQDFMALVKSDKRYKANRQFVFRTAVFAQDEV